MNELFVRGMWGLGDNFYQRPFIRLLAQDNDLYLDTPWPEIYADINVRPVKGYQPLRTQLKNLRRQDETVWQKPPAHACLQARATGKPLVDAYYSFNVIDGLFRTTGLPRQPLQWDFPPCPVAARDRPYAILRPVTVRREWRNTARNPLPEYVCQVAEWLRETHHVIVLADIDGSDETLVGDMPPHDEAILDGTSATELLSLIRGADVMAGGVGWIVPAGICAGTKTFVILGGQLRMNSPVNLLDRQYMDASRIRFATPDNPCNCLDMGHACDKQISNLRERFLSFRELFTSNSKSAHSRGGRRLASGTIPSTSFRMTKPTSIST